MNQEQVFLERRKLFQVACSPEEIRDLYIKTLRDFPERYRFSTLDYAQQGVLDVLQRRNFLVEHVKPGKIIDIGCGDGYFAIELGRDSREVVGVDMLEHRVRRANETAKAERVTAQFVYGFAEHIPYDPGTFDTAILSHMLEHVHDPMNVIREAVRVTRKGGELFAIVPNSIGRDPTHIRWIPSGELREILENFGTLIREYVAGTKGIGYICTLS